MPKVSVVMTAYRRPLLLEKTLFSIGMQNFPDKEVIVVEDGDNNDGTRTVCSTYGAKYLQRLHRPGVRYSNPAIPNNIGIRAAQGDVIILQNAEVEHQGETIEKLYDRVRVGHAVFAAVEAVNTSGGHQMWYTHSVHNPRPFFFCGTLHTRHFDYLRGFDERFTGYGYDDNQFADRLAYVGVKFDFADDIKVKHHEHTPSFVAGDPDYTTNLALYNQWKDDFYKGRVGPIANLDHEWGAG